MKSHALLFLLALGATAAPDAGTPPALPEIHWADTASGKPFSKVKITWQNGRPQPVWENAPAPGR